MAKLGLDGHDLGVKYISKSLMDAGMEVVYTGLQQTPEAIASIALQEDVDIIGCSFLSGAHIGLTKKLMAQLKAKGIEDKIVIIGGAIPSLDVHVLKEMGVAEVFPTASSVDTIIRFINNCTSAKTC